MSVTAKDIARAAVAAAVAQLEAHGLHAQVRDLDRLLSDAAHEHAGTVRLTIATPTGDIGPFVQTIAKAIEQKTGRPVDVRQKADKRIIGGAVVQYGDERIDMSLRGALDHAEELFAKTA
jgi:hypothetical protein